MAAQAALTTIVISIIGIALGFLILYVIVRAGVADGMKAYSKWRDGEVAKRNAARRDQPSA